MSTYSVLQRLWRDNQSEIDLHGTPHNGMQPYLDGLRAANTRIRAAMAGLARDDQPTMTKEQIEAWISRASAEQTVRSPPDASSSIWPSGASTAPETPLIEGVVLAPRFDDKGPDGAPR